MITIILIVAVQVYFMQKAFDQESRQLNQTIQIALQESTEQLSRFNNADLPYDNPVVRIRPEYYIVHVNGFIDADVLEHFLITSFRLHGLDLEFEFGIYDCQTDEMVYGRYVSYGKGLTKGEEYNFTKYQDYLYYFAIYFPGGTKQVLANLGVWYFFSFVLLIVLIFFGYSQLVILKQRRFTEIQADLINNLTHEFKTPISSIRMSADVIEKTDANLEPERNSRYVEIIKEQTDHLLSQIDRILIQSGSGRKIPLQRKDVSIQKLIAVLADEFRISQGQDLDLQFHSEIGKEMVNVDSVMIKQAIRNVLDNAVKYSPPPPTVRMILDYLDPSKKIIKLVIEDKGPGMPKQYQKRIFDRFFRIPAGNVHDIKGFGLGLHYVKQIAKWHSWKIRLESEEGEGTKFIFQIKHWHEG